MVSQRRVCVVGLGKLGAPIAACIASEGASVIAVDLDPHKVESVNRGVAPVFEPGLDDRIKAAGTALRATDDLASAVARSDTTFIVVPTPSEPGGGFSLEYVLAACEVIGNTLRTKDEFHLVAVTSTVMPGSTGGIIRATLEEASGKKAGDGFGLCYSPEFIALGTVIRDFLNPDFLLIGESDPGSGDLLEELYKEVCTTSAPVARMNFVNAELTKLAVNTFVTTKISFANMLARVCESLPGGDVDVVTTALGLDTRIGARYLKGAVSYGGPCFPRDNLAFTALAHEVGAPADLAEATDRFNRRQIVWLADLVIRHLPEGSMAGILGLTYKPDSDVVEEAMGLLLAKELLARDIGVIAFDPQGEAAAGRLLGPALVLADSPYDCLRGTDVVVVATPWQQIVGMADALPEREGRALTVIDCWRAAGSLGELDGVNYVPLGIGSSLEG